MLILRLKRIGKNKRPYYRLVVSEKARAINSGSFLEVLGSIDPHKKIYQLNSERILHWLNKGAQLSDTVHNLLIKQGIIKAKRISKSIRSKKKQAGEEKK